MPVIQNVSPAEGLVIQGTDPVQFDAVDVTYAFRSIVVMASYAGTTAYEVVHDGNVFAPLFADLSHKDSVADGFRFLVRRKGGWPGAATLNIVAINTNGDAAP